MVSGSGIPLPANLDVTLGSQVIPLMRADYVKKRPHRSETRISLTHTQVFSRRMSNSSLPRIAIVDRFRGNSWYTMHLLRVLKAILPPGWLHAYGLKEGNNDPNQLVSKVWSPYLYPLQILFRAIKDRVDLVHIQFEFFTFGSPQCSILLLLLIMILKIVGIKIAITLHGPVVPPMKLIDVIQELKSTISRLPASLLSVYVIALYRTSGRLSDITIVHSRGFKESLTEYGIDSRKIYVLPHGVPHGGNGKSEFRSEDAANILYFGTLSPRKGVETLLYAFSRVLQVFPNAKLIVAGRTLKRHSGYEKFLKSTASRLGLTNDVEFLGSVPDRQIPALFKRAIMIVFPYISSTAACGPLSFAMQFGKPVIATQTEYFKEILLHRKDAILFPPKDPDELTRAIIELLTNQALRIEIAKNLETKGKNYSWPKVARLTLELYLETISAKTK